MFIILFFQTVLLTIYYIEQIVLLMTWFFYSYKNTLIYYHVFYLINFQTVLNLLQKKCLLVAILLVRCKDMISRRP